MLDTRFPRPIGDIGNPLTLDRLGIPARYRVVAGANPNVVVRQAAAGLAPAFRVASRSLALEGARLIATSCGFLAMRQAALQADVGIPVLTSSLLWLPRLDANTAVLTIAPDALTAKHWQGAGASSATPCGGVLPGCEFQMRILNNHPTLDIQQAFADVVQGALRLCEQYPATSTIVLECSNMVPYADAVAQATGRRVEHIISLIETVWKL